jgi:hypothetical protein
MLMWPARSPALRAAEMTEDGCAVVPGIASFDVQLAGQERFAARGIDQVARLPVPGAAVLLLCLNARATLRRATLQLNAAHAAALDHLGAGTRGVADQDFVELRAAHVVRVRHRLVPGLREAKVLLAITAWGDELGAPFEHADGAYLVGDPQLFEQRQIGRQQRLADMEARMAVLLQQRDVVAAACQQGGDG